MPSAANIPQSPVYSVNPAPQSGSGLWGAVPGPVAVPNPFGDLSSVYPNLSQTDALASSALLSQENGQLSTDTLNQLQDTAAQYGVASGEAPNSGQENNLYLSSVAGASQALSQQGLSEYGSVIPTTTNTQTVAPSWQAQIAETNAINSAEANPFLSGLANTFSGLAGLGASAYSSYVGGGGGSGYPGGGTANSGQDIGSYSDYLGDSSNADLDPGNGAG